MLTIYVVRHGQAEFNAKRMIGGTYEPNPLTKEGETQARLLAEKFSNTKIDAIYSSDLSRAQKTAEIIASKHALKVETSTLLRERSWGSLQGKTFDEAQSKLGTLFEKERTINGEKAFSFKYVENMESLGEAVARFKQFLEKVIADERYKTILVVCHFDIMIGYLVSIDYGTYHDLMHTDFDHTGYYMLTNEDGTFHLDKVVGINKNNR